tara:strand:- start:21334 stop:21762 length:429 start_codon:yes stop_codon:yes gene_type:complete
VSGLLFLILNAGWREGLRPHNNVKAGKIPKSPPIRYKLGEGHEMFARKRLVWSNRQFEQCQAEYIDRGFNITPYHPQGDIPKNSNHDYVATERDMRHNLARICERFRKRKTPFVYRGIKIDTVKDFRVYLKFVKKNMIKEII